MDVSHCPATLREIRVCFLTRFLLRRRFNSDNLYDPEVIQGNSRRLLLGLDVER
jgi:hypothetical protein